MLISIVKKKKKKKKECMQPITEVCRCLLNCGPIFQHSTKRGSETFAVGGGNLEIQEPQPFQY